MSLRAGYTLPFRYKEQPVNVVWGSQLTLRRMVHVIFRFKEQDASSEANISSFTPVNRHGVRNTKVHHRIHKSPPLFLTLSQMYLTRTIPYCFSEIDFNIILPMSPGPSKLSLSLRLHQQNSLSISVLAPLRVTSPNHLILLDFMPIVMFDERCKSWSSSLGIFFPPHSRVIFFILGPNILTSTLCSNTPSSCALVYSSHQTLKDQAANKVSSSE